MDYHRLFFTLLDIFFFHESQDVFFDWWVDAI